MWPAICTTIDNGDTVQKNRAMQLLDSVMTRITISPKEGENLEMFDVAFGREIVAKLI